MALPAWAENFTIVTNSVPPIKIVENGTLTGVMGDLLHAVMNRTDHTLDDNIRVMPLKQALNETKDTPNTVCPALVRTPQRTPNYKWVGPVYTVQSGIIAKKKHNVHLPSLKDSKGMLFASVINSGPERMLLGRKLQKDQLLRFDTTQEAIQALIDDKVDALLMSLPPAFSVLKQMNAAPESYETVLVFNTMDLYFAFNADTDNAIIQELQKALKAIKKADKTGMSEYLKITSRYPGARH